MMKAEIYINTTLGNKDELFARAGKEIFICCGNEGAVIQGSSTQIVNSIGRLFEGLLTSKVLDKKVLTEVLNMASERTKTTKDNCVYKCRKCNSKIDDKDNYCKTCGCKI